MNVPKLMTAVVSFIASQMSAEVSGGFLCPRWNIQLKNWIQGEPQYRKRGFINLLKSNICSTIYFIRVRKQVVIVIFITYKENE